MVDPIVAVSLTAGLLLAQQQPGQIAGQPPDPNSSSATSGPQSPQWKGLTVKEKLRYDWVHLFDV
jgi:hypothetical protein